MQNNNPLDYTQSYLDREFNELHAMSERFLELINDAKEILENGVSEEMRKKIDSEEIK